MCCECGDCPRFMGWNKIHNDLSVATKTEGYVIVNHRVGITLEEIIQKCEENENQAKYRGEDGQEYFVVLFGNIKGVPLAYTETELKNALKEFPTRN